MFIFIFTGFFKMSVLTPILRAACWGVETARLDGTRTSPQLLFYVVRLL